jgi:SSS family solute:Na+ symporter
VLAVGLYLAAMLAIGFVSARRSSSSEHYFVGHRNYSGWLVGLSMLGSIISSTTFLALPAAAYVLDWRQLTVNLMVPFVAVLAVVIFIPFFRRGRLISGFASAPPPACTARPDSSSSSSFVWLRCFS